MKSIKTNFLYLIIYITCSPLLQAQNLELQIIGKDSVETRVIDSINYKSEHIDYGSLIKELEISQDKLQKIGFIENEIQSINKKNDSIFIAELFLNRKYDTIFIYYKNEDIGLEELKLISNNVTDDYFTIPIIESEKVLNYLNKSISEKGMPFTSLQIQNIKTRSENSLKGNLVVNKTNNRVIDDIVVKGYNKFPKSFLKRYLDIKKGQVFNLTDIKLKTENINGLSFANQIKDPEILFTKDSTTLYLYLEKNKSNTFDGFLGFGNNESTNKIEFNGYLNLNLVNNLNYGESFNLVYRSDENEQRTLKIQTKLPYLFNSPIGLNLGLDIFKKDSTYTLINQTAKIYYQLNRKNRVYAGIDIFNSNNLLNQSSSTLIEDFESSFFTISFEHEHIKANRLFPKQAYFIIEPGLGKRTSEEKNINQTSLNYKAFKIFNLNDKNSIFFNVNGQLLFSDDYLPNELKRFGGINSIRGFEENSLFASLYSVFNSEYRYSLNNGLFIHSIIDAAYYEDKTNALKEKLFGFGFGLGLLTKAGLFRLNYANGLTENQPFKFNNSKIHISLNAVF